MIDETISFSEIIPQLQKAYNKQQDLYSTLDYKANKTFWEIIKLLPDRDLLLWGDRVCSIKPVIGNPWVPTEWTRICSIIDQVKNRKTKWSDKQRRFVALMIIKYWDDLELTHL
jgi:hypothetical protein